MPRTPRLPAGPKKLSLAQIAALVNDLVAKVKTILAFIEKVRPLLALLTTLDLPSLNERLTALEQHTVNRTILDAAPGPYSPNGLERRLTSLEASAKTVTWLEQSHEASLGLIGSNHYEIDLRLRKLEAATGVNPPATGKTVERSILARLDTIERFMTESRP